MKRFGFLFLLLVFIYGELHAQSNLFATTPKDIEKLNINTPFSDFGSAIIDGEIYFSSSEKEQGQRKSDPKFFNLYSIPLNEAEMKNPNRYREDDLKSNFHDGPISYCSATQELFVTRSDSLLLDTKKGIINKKYIRLGILVYKRENESWVFKEDFPFNNVAYSVGQPAVNTTGDTLIFVSDQRGGYGKTDLYYSVRKDSIWQKPQNLGPTINTKKREMTPFINNDGKLIFASDGQGGQGGLDIFWSKRNNNRYTKPINLGYPFNSKEDDFGLTIHPNQLIAYLTSNRNSKKNDDNLYRIKTKDYNLTVLDSLQAQQQIESLKSELNDELSNYTADLKKKGQIANNVKCSVDFKIIDDGHVPSLRISYSYQLLTDTLRLGLNTYKIGQYMPQESNIVSALLTRINWDIDHKLKHYFTSNKRINLFISNTTDIFPFNEINLYKGEYGDLVQAKCTQNGAVKTIQIARQAEIDYEELTFLRIFGMKNDLLINNTSFRNTLNSYNYEIITGNQIEKNQKWVKIEFTIQNAFGNF